METWNLDGANKMEMPEAGLWSLAAEGRAGSCSLANLRHHRTFLSLVYSIGSLETSDFTALVVCKMETSNFNTANEIEMPEAGT